MHRKALTKTTVGVAYAQSISGGIMTRDSGILRALFRAELTNQRCGNLNCKRVDKKCDSLRIVPGSFLIDDKLDSEQLVEAKQALLKKLGPEADNLLFLRCKECTHFRVLGTFEQIISCNRSAPPVGEIE